MIFSWLSWIPCCFKLTHGNSSCMLFFQDPWKLHILLNPLSLPISFFFPGIAHWCFSIKLFQKKFKWGDWEYTFLNKKPSYCIEFLDLSLPTKFCKKQAFIPGNSTNVYGTLWKLVYSRKKWSSQNHQKSKIMDGSWYFSICLAMEFPRDATQFCRIFRGGWSFALSGISKG